MIVVSSWDSKCDVCGEIELFPIRCKQCGGVYCDTHMPSGKHRCVTSAATPKKASKLAGSRKTITVMVAPFVKKMPKGGIVLLVAVLLLALVYFALAAFSDYSSSAGHDSIVGTWKSYDGFTGTDLGDSITFNGDGTFYAKKYLTTSFSNPYISDVSGNWTRGDNAYYILAWRPAGTDTGSSQLPDTLSYVRYSSDTGSLVFVEQASLRSAGLFPTTVVFKKA